MKPRWKSLGKNGRGSTLHAFDDGYGHHIALVWDVADDIDDQQKWCASSAFYPDCTYWFHKADAQKAALQQTALGAQLAVEALGGSVKWPKKVDSKR